MSPHLLLSMTLPALASEVGSHGGNAAAEVLFVVLMLIVIWGAFRITSKRRQ